MIDIDAILELDRAVPRYTSYPTAPMWRPLPQGTWEAALADVTSPASVYVHVPFCKEQCWFCGCNMVVSRRQAAGDRYLDALTRQVEELPLPGGSLEIARLHLGGGTPTWLDEAQLTRLYDLLFARFTPVDDAELSVEIDPDVTSDAQLDLLASRGVNRVSIGVQSFDPVVLAAVNRPQDPERIRQIARRSRSHGMRGLNLDLIYGLPKQSMASLEATIERVGEIAPDRIALYGFAFVPWSKPHQERLDASAMPGPRERLEMFLAASDLLTARGYQRVGLDHFALPDDELAVALRDGKLHRNFMGYTTRPDLELIGLGPSGISELRGAIAAQHAHLGEWYRAVERGEDPIHRGWVMSAEDRLRADVIGALMCNLEVRYVDMAARHHVDFGRHFAAEMAALAALSARGLVEVTPDRIAVTPSGRLLVRNVAAVFDAWLARGEARYSRAV